MLASARITSVDRGWRTDRRSTDHEVNTTAINTETMVDRFSGERSHRQAQRQPDRPNAAERHIRRPGAPARSLSATPERVTHIGGADLLERIDGGFEYRFQDLAGPAARRSNALDTLVPRLKSTIERIVEQRVLANSGS